jgi:hypothetical protein
MSKNHHGKVRQPEIKIGILLVQSRHRAVLISGQPFNTEPADATSRRNARAAAAVPRRRMR